MPVEKSWIVRTIILPACMISPLWYRFNQNLRQTYDSRKRWPYLGNALKYLAAAEVAMFGTFDPSRKTSPTWLFFAVLATLYQIWWDIFSLLKIIMTSCYVHKMLNIIRRDEFFIFKTISNRNFFSSSFTIFEEICHTSCTLTCK